MKYIEVVKLIRGICTDINPNGTFIHGTEINKQLSYDKPYPVIIMEPVPDSQTEDLETSKVTMAFMFQDQAESSVEQQEILIDKADVMRREFQTRLRDANSGVTTFNGTPFYRLYAGVNSGYLLTFEIIGKRSVC